MGVALEMGRYHKRYPKDYFKDRQQKRFSKSDEEGVPRLHEFLERYSSLSHRVIRNRVLFYYTWIQAHYPHVNHILEIEYDHARTFLLEEIEPRPITKRSKGAWKSTLLQYYRFIGEFRERFPAGRFEEEFGVPKERFIIPIPERVSFSKKPVKLTEIRQKYMSEALTYSTVLRLLNYCYYNQFELFIFLGFCIWSGARIREVVSIEDANIEINDIVHIDEHGQKEFLKLRFFITSLKRTHQEDKWGVYCFPDFFTKYITLHIEQKNLLYPSKFLFPSPYLKEKHLGKGTMRRRVNKACALLNITQEITPHKLRALLNTYRDRKGVDPDHKSLLLNHTIDRMEARHYNLDYGRIIPVQKIYNDSFPFPEFKPDPNYLSRKKGGA